MIIIRSPSDVSNSRLPTHLANYIGKLLAGIIRSVPNFNAEHDGHIVLITPRDTDIMLCEKIGVRWADSTFEGVGLNPDYRCYHAVIQHNNQFTVSIIVPDEPTWLDPAIRDRMNRETA